MAVTLLLFAGAREAAGTGRATFPTSGLGELLDEARRRYGPEFAVVLASARVWVNGESPDGDPEELELRDGDEVAVLPPVSGG